MRAVAQYTEPCDFVLGDWVTDGKTTGRVVRIQNGRLHLRTDDWRRKCILVSQSWLPSEHLNEDDLKELGI